MDSSNTDERVMAAVLEALRRQRGRSKGTVKGLQVLVGQILEDTHGRGVVEMPSRSSQQAAAGGGGAGIEAAFVTAAGQVTQLPWDQA